jgi:hypothetical protein
LVILGDLLIQASALQRKEYESLRTSSIGKSLARSLIDFSGLGGYSEDEMSLLHLHHGHHHHHATSVLAAVSGVAK